jgi:hypothetical protein
MKSSITRMKRRIVVLAMSMISAMLTGNVRFHAQTPGIFKVDHTADDGTSNCEDNVPADCSLRGAIQRANALAGADSVELPAGVYALTIQGAGEDAAGAGDLDITDDLTIQGAGAATTIVSGLHDRVFHIDPAARGVKATIRGVTIQNGSTGIVAFVDSAGAGILLGAANTAGDPPPSGMLTLIDSVVRAGFAEGNGGGVANKAGTLVVIRSTISGNTSHGIGAGIFSRFTAQTTIIDSTISNNLADNGDGGGLYVFGGQVTVANTTISGNRAVGSGGGIVRSYGTLTVVNSTISDNTSGDGAGILISPNDQSLNIVRGSTISNNHAGGFANFGGTSGGISSGGQIELANTILAGNTRASGDALIGTDCVGTIQSAGYNLIQNPGVPCAITGDPTGNIVGQNPQLGPLADHGGPTRTHAPLANSPAIDAGNPGAPGSGGATCEPTDQRGAVRPQDGNGDGVARCDIGAYEASSGTTLDGIAPDHAGNVAPVCASILGHSFASGDVVRLARAGEADIVGDPVHVLDGGHVISTAFGLAGKRPGRWNVVVTHSDGTSDTLDGGFTVDDGGAPDVWHEILGPTDIRIGLPTRVFFFYGNRGNVDALAVPVKLAVPRNVGLRLLFPVLPPPGQPGQPAIDWSSLHTDLESADETIVSLLIPIIPAGFTGALEFLLTPPSNASAGEMMMVDTAVGAPLFHFDSGATADGQPILDDQTVHDLVAGAQAYASRVLGINGLDETVLEQHVRDSLRGVLGGGIDAWLATGGGTTSDGTGGTTADGQAPYCYPCVAPFDPLLRIGTPIDLSKAGSSPGCREVGWLSCRPRPCETIPCPCGKTFTYRYSADPNDKVGAGQDGGGRWIAGVEPLRYAIYFENDPLHANAPAQEVVVTDQLDVARLDLGTFSFGPISFGERTLVPTPGLKEYVNEVDLRPAANLLVRVIARLETTTGVVSWRFSSLDPVTHQPTTDPVAGFLPPNVNPPEGDGSVVFTVRHKSGLSTGAEICNDASIVFDANAPIVTPLWCNTLDNTKPVSQVVQPAAATQTSVSFTVQWSGSDVGSGIQDYSIFVSADGGPFAPFVLFTENTSATFTGQPGTTYAFYSVARDKMLNVEDPPASADVRTTILGLPTLTVNKVCDPISDNGRFSLRIDGVVEATDTTCGGSTGAVPVSTGAHTISEIGGNGTDLADYVAPVISGDCAANGAITLGLGQSKTCTVTNTRKGTARVVKTVSGAPPSATETFTFQLRQGATALQAGTILESANAIEGNSGAIAFASKLAPLTNYQLCEVVMPGWMTTLGPPFFVVFNPSGDNSTVCTDFTPMAGEARTFSIDNRPPPGGLGRAIGFWKNWATCAASNGNQKPVLDQTLGSFPVATGRTTRGVYIGDMYGDTCQAAVRILNKQNVNTGMNMSSDPAFNLAAQLLAAKLNVQAGAGTCPAAVAAINDSQAQLAALHFDGVTRLTIGKSLAGTLQNLAATLEKYNQNTLC